MIFKNSLKLLPLLLHLENGNYTTQLLFSAPLVYHDERRQWKFFNILLYYFVKIDLDNWALSCSRWSYYSFQSINQSIYPSIIFHQIKKSWCYYSGISTVHFRLRKDIYHPFSTYCFTWAFYSNMSALSLKAGCKCLSR